MKIFAWLFALLGVAYFGLYLFGMEAVVRLVDDGFPFGVLMIAALVVFVLLIFQLFFGHKK